jgi:hypothetical protein
VRALAIATYLFVNLLAVIFGTAYGGVIPLYAVLAREYFGQQIMGTVFGAATFGMTFGPRAGGWGFDRFDAYSWLSVGCSASGSARSQWRSPSRRCRRDSASSCRRRECHSPVSCYCEWSGSLAGWASACADVREEDRLMETGQGRSQKAARSA